MTAQSIIITIKQANYLLLYKQSCLVQGNDQLGEEKTAVSPKRKPTSNCQITAMDFYSTFLH